MDEKKDQVMELTTEVETDSTEDVSVGTEIEIIPESNGPSGKLVAGIVAGVAAITAGAVFLYKRHKKKKANKQDEDYEDFDEIDEDDETDDDYLGEENSDQENDKEPEQSEKDKKKPTKK